MRRGEKKVVLLSFDVEEFDLPKEHGREISLEEGVEISSEGLERIFEVLDEIGAKATFFVTANFAKQRPEMIVRMIKNGHEVGCHGVEHFRPRKTDIEVSKKEIEKITGVKVKGWRQPRMQKIDYEELARRGFLYDSSVNPAFVPGRYNNLRVEKRPFRAEAGVIEMPVSVATKMRVPMFWLSLHLFPFGVYKRFMKEILRREGYFTTYWHPWEFGEIRNVPGVPGFIKVNSGRKLEERLRKLIIEMEKEGAEFLTYGEFLGA